MPRAYSYYMHIKMQINRLKLTNGHLYIYKQNSNIILIKQKKTNAARGTYNQVQDKYRWTALAFSARFACIFFCVLPIQPAEILANPCAINWI